MERPIFKPLGTPAEELDTPALVLDMAAFEKNLGVVHEAFKKTRAKLRPYVGTHRTPALAHAQLAAGGTVGGVAVGTVGQAEAFAESGISDIWITTQVIGAAKIARVCALARRAAVTVVVDSAGNVDELAKAARAAGVTIRVSVDIHTGLNGTGVEPGKPAVDLATRVAKAKGLEFTGFSTYEGAILKKGAALENESRKWIQMVLDTRQAAEKAGLDVKTVSAGGTHNYDIAASMKGVTEVPAGTYALLDERYRTLRKELKPAASVMASIISTPEPSVAVGDAGMKGCGNDTGLPGVKGRPDLGIKYLSAEHTNFIMDKAKRPFALGEKVSLIPWEIAVTCNLYDYIMAVRKDRLEAVLNVTARGRYR